MNKEINKNIQVLHPRDDTIETTSYKKKEDSQVFRIV